MQISVIVPTLDEERALEATLEHLLPLTDDIVVSDGGSGDRTADIAAAYAVTWVEGEASRGAQLNLGANAVRGDVLLFVHADTRLPPDAMSQIGAAVDAGALGGGFEVRFDSQRRLMAIGSRLVNWRTRLTRVPLGDQAQFLRRDVFERLGGYRNWPILEDLDLMRRLKRLGRVTIIRSPVSTSDRRFARQGILRTLVTNYGIWGLFALGVDPRKLARLYRHVR